MVINPSTEVVVLEHGKRTGAALSASWIAEPEALQKENPEIEKHSQALVQSILVSSPKEKQERIQQLIESLGVGHLDTSVRAQLKALLREFHDGFALSDKELGCTDVITHTIDMEGRSPIRQPPRRIPFALRSKVEEMVTGMLDQGIVQPSQSAWASQIVLVAKKDGSTRFCVDYRRLNAATKVDMCPLPCADDCLDLLANNCWFSTLDLASGYWQVQLEESSREKTAFTTHVGLFEFWVMPFGLCSAPATFQRLMERVLAGWVTFDVTLN